MEYAYESTSTHYFSDIKLINAKVMIQKLFSYHSQQTEIFLETLQKNRAELEIATVVLGMCASMFASCWYGMIYIYGTKRYRLMLRPGEWARYPDHPALFLHTGAERRPGYHRHPRSPSRSASFSTMVRHSRAIYHTIYIYNIYTTFLQGHLD